MTPKLTAAGKNLLLCALAGETINFTKVQLGNGPAQIPTEATELVNPIIDVEFTDIDIGTSYVTLTAVFTNGSVTSGFHVTEAGYFATDPDDETNEILYAIGNEDESTADYVPDKTSRILEMQFDSLVFIGDAENVTAAISSSLVYASKEEFDAHTEDNDNPHGVTKAQVGLGNVPNVSTSDQTPAFTEETTLANINSGETLGTIFGKIKLAITNLINHLSARDNPHKCTAAQVGAAALAHTHSASNINNGVLPTIRGGTGMSAPASGGVLLGNDKEPMRELLGTGALYAASNGYPTFNTLPVSCGGTGVTSMAALATALATAGGLAKVASGTYVGNGLYGSANKRSLSFTSPPRLLVVMPADNTGSAELGGFMVLSGVTSAKGGGLMDDVNFADSQVYYEWNGNAVSWYSSRNDYAMQNMNGKTYAYFAIL